MLRRSVFLLVFLIAGCGTADKQGGDEGDPCEIVEQGSQRCSGSVIQTCDGTEWTDGIDCRSTSRTCAQTGNTTAECESPPSCTDGDTRCSGDFLQTCTAGAWDAGVDCSPDRCTTVNATTAQCESRAVDITVGDNEDFVIKGIEIE